MALNKQTAFLKYVSFLSSDKQPRLCFPEGVSWSSSAPRLPQKELGQEEDEVGGRKVRRWRRDRLQEEGQEDCSSISLLLSEIKNGLRINWISPLSRFPQRSNDIRNVRDELTVNPRAVTTRLDAVSLRTAAGIWTSALPLSSSARSLKQSHWRVHIILLYSNCQQPLASSSRVPWGRSQSWDVTERFCRNIWLTGRDISSLQVGFNCRWKTWLNLLKNNRITCSLHGYNKDLWDWDITMS